MAFTDICYKDFTANVKAVTSGASIERSYVIKGYKDETDAGAALLAWLDANNLRVLVSKAGNPAYIDNVDLNHIANGFHNAAGSPSPESSGAILGENIFEAKVTWNTRSIDPQGGPDSPVPPDRRIWSLSTSKEPTTVTISLGRVFKKTYSPDLLARADPDDFGFVLAVKEGDEGRHDTPEGIQVPGPGDLNYSIERPIPAGSLNTSVLRELQGFVKTINEEPFDHWKAQEVCFLGVEFNKRGDEGIAIINYNFSVSLEVEDFNPFNEAPESFLDGLPTKHGWDYFWAMYREDIGPEGLGIIPQRWFLDQVMPIKDWGPLAAIIG